MKSKNKFLGIIAVSTVLSMGGYAQQPVKKMTLNECIRHAQERNINISKQELNVRGQSLNVASAKNQFLPAVNASVNHGWNFGRSQDKRGVFVDQSSANSSVSIGANIDLFSGMRRLYGLNAAKLDLQASLETLEQAKQDLALQVAQLYINLLFQQELTKIAEMQIGFTKEQLLNAGELVRVGRWPKSKQVELEAQLSKEEMNLVEAQNNESMARLELTQALEMSNDSLVEIVAPEVDELVSENRMKLTPADETYKIALSMRPSLKSAELNIRSAEEQVKAARSAHWPTLSLSAGYSNSYYKLFGNIPQGAIDIPFRDQIKQNGRSYIGLSLNIPIFNRLETMNSVKQRKLQIDNNRLQLENEKKVLYKEINQAYLNAVGANRKIIATEKARISSKLAYEYAEERLNADKINILEFTQAKTNYMLSQAEELRSKYDFIYKSKVLDFYRGIDF
ncbi:TolC family protein [Porphyromonas macacae]|uniref:Outer membrane efflux protein BepC n=1 Tax=Porphyromonas macacae TaxID=28115 RepID=A0A379DIZ9_9PORP|nr:TolC family protein [Porphyromonas macacae]SUB78349.1 Outer membrane efflux protein BepC precursor [Porphyromonas macacae]